MKKLIIANWKMNPKSFGEAEGLFETVKKSVKKSAELAVVICPPSLWLRSLKAGANIALGAQNCHWEISGAFTGEQSAFMLADAGAEYVILGHSERRQFMGETDEVINLKIKAALKAKLKVVLCVGEKLGEEMGSVVEGQMTAALEGLNVNQMKEMAIAYEPVWAIGTGKACSADDALSTGLFIRKTITKLYSRFLAEKTPVLYGGSVSSQNSASYITQARLDGLLIGGASLEAEEFLQIIKNIA